MEQKKIVGNRKKLILTGVTEQEKEIIRQASHILGLSICAFIRSEMLKRSKKVLEAQG